ncbi:hypothetical protein KQ876_03445 [Mycoplasma sp. CSL7491-lung]|uniref:hypothetical protein n=1 Tax=Mycoplasma sp. CSL7491-lung TaxID=549718 RepID=UPI001C102619|nr:hypothetical protein [Mycoplasma sp. CSL7491-lung]MBU4693243.1 hypothetical protein [Mycoplasma sp. CSL7491-lung]
MSVKGNSLENRGSEYLFANLEREKIRLSNFKKLNYLSIYNEINKYFVYYSFTRLQKI